MKYHYRTSVTKDGGFGEPLVHRNVIKIPLDPFFQELQQRREDNRDKEVEIIISKIRSRVDNNESGRIDVFSNYVDDEIERQVRSRIGDVDIKRNQVAGHPYTTYIVQW